MASKTFTPSNAVDTTKERDWPASLGMLDWDSTRIVFTKRKLIEFLKYVDVTVDPNFSNISKLPRYAQFMNVTADEKDDGANAQETVVEDAGAAPNSYRASRRVRTAPGGASSDIFGLEGTEDDALSRAPPLQQSSVAKEEVITEEAATPQVTKSDDQPAASNVRPSRRVRTAPGGKDSLSELWGGADNDEEAFKPSRRVRQIPGGQDNLAGIL
ncbi:hypothetical protein SCHPADRAFT_945328 [Schizopora paradoxa]|uniref:Uncharacterized protein n=1 Tax=Schizopora paradoxa TaxID=27342 RepID=A0A0H2R695_9AGAM|nr:hypothetical protein SCHPADRAFT_945328 [Schizopora paradoxa]